MDIYAINKWFLLFGVVALGLVAGDGAQSTSPVPRSAPGYLTEVIPPCTPVAGASVDPCDPAAPPIDFSPGHPSLDLVEEPVSLEEMLDDKPPPSWLTHLVARDTYLPKTLRCTTGDPFRPPSYLREEFGNALNERSLKCYIDVRVNAYVLGAGPSSLTTMLWVYSYGDHQIDHVQQEARPIFETAINEMFPGREHIIFLGPAVDLSSETWRSMGFWDVQKQEDGTVVAVHPDRDLWQRLRPDEYQAHRSALEMELPAFAQALTGANQACLDKYGGRIGADPSLPKLITDANQLREYYVAVGAYDHPDGQPAQPPPAR